MKPQLKVTLYLRARSKLFAWRRSVTLRWRAPRLRYFRFRTPLLRGVRRPSWSEVFQVLNDKPGKRRMFFFSRGVTRLRKVKKILNLAHKTSPKRLFRRFPNRTKWHLRQFRKFRWPRRLRPLNGWQTLARRWTASLLLPQVSSYSNAARLVALEEPKIQVASKLFYQRLLKNSTNMPVNLKVNQLGYWGRLYHRRPTRPFYPQVRQWSWSTLLTLKSWWWYSNLFQPNLTSLVPSWLARGSESVSARIAFGFTRRLRRISRWSGLNENKFFRSSLVLARSNLIHRRWSHPRGWFVSNIRKNRPFRFSTRRRRWRRLFHRRRRRQRRRRLSTKPGSTKKINSVVLKNRPFRLFFPPTYQVVDHLLSKLTLRGRRLRGKYNLKWVAQRRFKKFYFLKTINRVWRTLYSTYFYVRNRRPRWRRWLRKPIYKWKKRSRRIKRVIIRRRRRWLGVIRFKKVARLTRRKHKAKNTLRRSWRRRRFYRRRAKYLTRRLRLRRRRIRQPWVGDVQHFLDINWSKLGRRRFRRFRRRWQKNRLARRYPQRRRLPFDGLLLQKLVWFTFGGIRKLQLQSLTNHRRKWLTSATGKLFNLFFRGGSKSRVERLQRRVTWLYKGKKLSVNELYYRFFTALGTRSRRQGGLLVKLPSVVLPRVSLARTRRWIKQAVLKRGERGWWLRAENELVSPVQSFKLRESFVNGVYTNVALL